MSSKIMLLLTVAAVATLVYTIPVITLFVGSHSTFTFDNDANSGVINVTVGGSSEEYCKQCHSKVWSELYSNPNAPHSDLSCETCHRYKGTGIQFAIINSTGAHPGRQAHAAYVPNCLECHWKSTPIRNVYGGISYAPAAAGFNVVYAIDNLRIPNYTIDVSQISYYAAHKKLIEYANNTLGDMNIGCLLCHTNHSKKITYSYHWNLNYSTLNWSFTSFSPNGTRTYTVDIAKSTEFSGKHEFISGDDVNCSMCHENIYKALVVGTDERYFTHAPIEIPDNLGLKPWGTTNLWNHPRYHYVPPAYRAEWVNNTYCKECHNNASIPDTAASKDLIHCAEKVSCLTCHGYGRTYDPYYPILYNQTHSSNASGHEDLLNQTAEVYRMYHGDVCMGCHEAAMHPSKGSGGCGGSEGDEGGHCGWCHTKGSVDIYIESEPSGYAEGP